ncbi:MAG: heparinase II/III domain-containing protein [Armatimonadota bacterium]
MTTGSNNEFEAARRAKVLSVDPRGIARSELDGSRDRAGVFELLRSFDDKGMASAEFELRTLELLAVPDARNAADVLRHYLQYFASLDFVLHPEAQPANLRHADELLRNRFTFAGEAHDLPERIDWDANPGTPHWGYDLNRFDFLYTLRDAFVETGERRYAEKAARLILDWIAHTDICDSFTPGPDPTVWQLSVKSRYVWLSHLEPAIHLLVWGEVLSGLLRRIPDLLAPYDFLRILKSVHDQLTWLAVIIPEGGHGNGLIAGAGCQLIALAYLPAFRDATSLAQIAVKRIEATLEIQVLPDGVQHELTPHYHFCVTKDLLHAAEALCHLPVPPPANLRATLRKMLWYARQTLTPDGKQIAFNDGDGGLGWWVIEELEKPTARDIFGELAEQELTSMYSPYGGVMFLRQGSRVGREELYLAFDGGPYGNVHQHEDKLSFWLSAYGRSFIVDPGRYIYDHDPSSFYTYLLTTKAHSTILIDGQGQNSKAHREQWVSRVPLPLTWEADAQGNITAGAVYDLGYGQELIPVTHARTIRFVPQPGYWILEDTLCGEGRHDIESRFQFAPGALNIEETVARTTFSDANLALFFRPHAWDAVRIEEGQKEPYAGWYSDRLNQIEPAPALVFQAQGRALPQRVRMLLFPYRGERMPEEARRLWEEIGASAFRC